MAPLTAVLTGTFRNPELRFAFGWGATLRNGKSAQDWVKKLPGRRFDKSEKTWYITGTGANPDTVLAAAGITVDYSEATGDLAGLTSLEPLWRPMVQRSSRFPHMAFVRPRLAGFERMSAILGPGAVWDKNRQRFDVMLADLVTDDGEPKKGLRLDPSTYEASVQTRQLENIPEDVRAAARELAASTGVEGDHQDEVSPRTQELIDIVAAHTGYLPKWFGLALYPFQLAGAYAIAGGHRALTDAPGLGKCVLPGTEILANGTYSRIEDLWTEAAAGVTPVPDYDGVGEIITLLPGELSVDALDDTLAAARTVSASHLYREHISAPVKTIRTQSGAVITSTIPHRFLTPAGWENAIKPGDSIAAPSSDPSQPIEWTKVTAVEYSDYDGWVYDLTVPEGANYIAEGLWCHNTRQALAAAAIKRSRRTVIVVPPLVVENWCREAYAALGPGLSRIQPPEPAPPAPAKGRRTKTAKPARKPDFPPYIVPIRAGKKVPPFPDAGVVVVADSLLGGRPELLDQIIAWKPNAALFDEVHRSRTWAGQRATANRNLACSIDALRLPMTGTPFLQNPAEGVNMLSIAGLLDPVFGGASKFMQTYTTQNFFGAFLPNRKMLPQLEQVLTRHCWVRRNKADVLKQLPPKLRTTRYVEIDTKGFKAAHDALYEKVQEWIEEQNEAGEPITSDAIKTFARTRVDLITPLRAAAGVAKVPAAIEIINDWLEATTETAEDGTKVYTRPLTVWVHHKPVMEALVAAVEKAGIADAGFIDGGTPQHKRQAVADRLQNGEIGVIFCSIQAAGFGITLTRSSDTIFIETDWTPANISQAEDRCVVEGQSVQTERGPVPIEEISIGDVVLTHEGNWRPVTDVWSRGARDTVGARKIITEVSFMGQQEPLAVTHDHEIWVRRANGTIEWAFASTILPGDNVATPKMKLGDFDIARIAFPESCRRWTDEEIHAWSVCKVCGSDKVLARGLCQRHYTLMKRDHRRQFGAKTPLPKLTERRPNGRYIPMPSSVELTPEFLSFCGLYVAEGFSTVDEAKGAFVSISGHSNEESILQAHGDYIQRTFGFKYTIRKATGLGVEMRIYSQDLASWFLGMFGHRAQNKRFPSWVFDLSERQLEQIFLGYLAGDGHAKLSGNGEKVVLAWRSVSATLNDQLSLIAATLGYRTGSRVIEGGPREIMGKDCVTLNAHVGEFTDDVHAGKWIWRRVSVVSSRYARREERLWDLSVEGDESYVVGAAAVHNCHRIGQTETTMVTTLLATNTLDAHMRAILRNKAKDLNVLLPGADNNVTKMTSVLNEDTNAYEALTEEDKELEKNFKSLGDIVESIVLDVLGQRGYGLAA